MQKGIIQMANNPLRIVFLTKDGTYLPFAVRCLIEGAEVRVCWTKPRMDKIGVGMVEEISLGKLAAWKPDAVVVDCTGMGKIADRLRKSGLPVYGGSELADLLEYERDKVLDVLENAGIDVPETYSTRNVGQAIAYVRKKGEAFVIKLDGEKGAGSSLTYVGQGPEDVIEMLETYSGKIGGALINLQTKVRGIEISTEGFFDGKKFLDGMWNHTLERKKFMNGDIGPNTGCAGDVMWWTDTNKVIEQGIKKLEPVLGKMGFYGQIDLNTIVERTWKDGTKDPEIKVWGLELTPRFGINASVTLMQLTDQPMARFFVDAAHRQVKDIKKSKGYAVSVTVSIPPHPNKTAEIPSKDIPVLFDMDLLSRVNPLDMWWNKDHFESAGGGGWICSPAGSGATVKDAKYQAYDTVASINLPNKQYRTDIGDQAQDDIKTLERWGML